MLNRSKLPMGQELMRHQRSIELDAKQAWRAKFGTTAGAQKPCLLLRTDSAYEEPQGFHASSHQAGMPFHSGIMQQLLWASTLIA